MYRKHVGNLAIVQLQLRKKREKARSLFSIGLFNPQLQKRTLLRTILRKLHRARLATSRSTLCRKRQRQTSRNIEIAFFFLSYLY